LDDIRLVILDLKRFESFRTEAPRILSSDERQRVERLKVPEAATNFLLIRALLRRCLGSRLGLDPATLVFRYGPHGKPFLAGPGAGLSFNVSHSGGIAAFAFAEGRDLGVDVERIRAVDADSLAERYFSAPEAILYRVQIPEKREAAFFHFWTAKEAYLKARGVGMTEGLKGHSISEPWEDPPRLTWVQGDEREVGRWTFHRFWPAEDVIGTLTYSGRPAKIKEVHGLGG
jgi:4'-phosphopantetheinyl transferase